MPRTEARFSKLKTPVGDFFLAATAEGLVLGSFNEYFARSRKQLEAKCELAFRPASKAGRTKAEKHLSEAAGLLKDYFAGKKVNFKKIPIASVGTDFQKKTWNALRAIPYGKTLSYGELATKLKVRDGSRAVGGACGKNPVAIIVPCHRVLHANKGLGGFSGGLSRKKTLLSIEKVKIR